jgi:hypothetical protein
VDFTNRLAEIIGIALEKQRRFLAVAGERAWTVDVNERVLAFQDENRVTTHTFQADCIAVEFPPENKLQWAWAFTGDTPDVGARAASEAVKAWGTQHSVEEFILPAFHLDQLRTGMRVALVSASVMNADALFIATTPDGAMVNHLAIRSPLLSLGPIDLRTVARVVLDIVAGHPVQHRKAIIRYFEDRGLTVTQPMGRVVGTTAEGTKIRVMFDSLGRVENLQGDFALPEGVPVFTNENFENPN